MANQNNFTPKVNRVPFQGFQKVPLEQAISQVGQASGLTPRQAARSAALTQAGIANRAVIIGNPKVK